ncbi:odorant receptor 131-2-like [Hippoglossus hippoglossus]|uniref:odorant receptor 131-2-like n=1 Tax=Hippoglossus hippoglossus TaxID=8267 RepID=UPI00148E2023|nr:odorant receptor 131-2-like [Hippoglossus hippoglossus]
MSRTAQANITTGWMFLERVMMGTVTSVPCCIFFFINVTMLFTLRSKAVFRESSRYILLYNLLVADTMQMALSQLMYLLAVCRTRLSYPVCGLLIMLANFTNEISPLTLVVMSLERYVAVCQPLRHATIITITNTALAIIVVWAISSLNVLVRVLLLLDFPFENLDTLQMKDFCGTLVLFLGPMSDDYDKAYTCFVFVSATVVITCTYIGVMVAARSASTDKASARKARNTLLLHLVQLGLSLLSTIHNSVIGAISKIVTRPILLIILNTLYVFLIMLPRCLSSLIYGLRDKTIRPVFLYHLCCGLRLKAEVSP